MKVIKSLKVIKLSECYRYPLADLSFTLPQDGDLPSSALFSIWTSEFLTGLSKSSEKQNTWGKMVNRIIFPWKRGENTREERWLLAERIALPELCACTGSQAARPSGNAARGRNVLGKGRAGSPQQGAGLGCFLHCLPACKKALVQLDNWW